MMRKMMLLMTLSEAEKALWAGRHAMIVPLTDAETAQLGRATIAVHEFLQFNLKCLSTLQQVLESTGDKEERIAKTLHMLLEPARVAVELQDQSRELLGRAVFIGPQTEKEKLQ